MGAIKIDNIEDVRQYASNLRQAGEVLSNVFQQIGAQTNYVCSNWDDQKSRQFVQELATKQNLISQLSHQLEDFSEYIKRLCDAAEQYANIN